MNSKDGISKMVDFYILMCIKTAFIFKQTFKCPWGHEFNVGDMVVARKYYQRWGNSNSFYVLLQKSQPAHIHVCHVRAIKFPMFPTDHRI
jgi:hypothetical protein